MKMKKFHLGQRLGEGVKIYKKTEEDVDFVQQERLVDTTRDATDKLVKCLAPKSGPKNRAKKLAKMGEKMQEVDKFNSVFGKGVATLGESMKEIGHVHAELENRIQLNTINPLKTYRDGDLKEAVNIKKRYESNRLEYDTARRAYQSKSTADNEDKMKRAKTRYEEARDVYYEKLQHSQDNDYQHVEHLKAYTRHMIEYHRKCMEIFEEAEKQLDSFLSSSPACPVPLHKNSDQESEGFLLKGQAVSQMNSSYQNQPYQQQPPCEKPMRQYQQPCEKPVHQQPSSVPTSTPILPQRGQNPRPVSISGKMQAPAGPVVGTGFHQEHMRMSKGYEQASVAFPGGPPHQEKCRALYDFDPVDVPHGIPIRSGDVITVLNKTPSGWWEGELRGRTGFFPSNYVQPL